MQEILLKGNARRLPDLGIGMSPSLLSGDSNKITVTLRTEDQTVDVVDLEFKGFGTAPDITDMKLHLVNGVGKVDVVLEKPWMKYYTFTCIATYPGGNKDIKTIHNHVKGDKYDVSYYTSLPQYITVSETGTYNLELSSSGGGGGSYYGNQPGGNGGSGEKVKGTVTLEAGKSYLITAGSGGYGGSNRVINGVETPSTGEQGESCYLLDGLTEKPIEFMTFRYALRESIWEGGKGGLPPIDNKPGLNGERIGLGDGSKGGYGGVPGGSNSGRGDNGFNGHIFITSVV